MESLFQKYTECEIEDFIKKISLLIENRLSDKEILETNKIEFIEELLSISKARLRSKESDSKHIGDLKYFNESDLRFSTPLSVAKYRASRLKCNKIVDLCSGISIQSAAFSNECKEVHAFEIDKRKVEYSKRNFSKIKNLRFYDGDILSEKVIQLVNEIKPDIIFCDPQRLESEAQRNIASITPDLINLLEIYSKITPNLSIELPPQISKEELNHLKQFGEFEAEYLSMNNKLNRLTLYFNDLKKADISVADISGIKLEKNNKSKVKTQETPLEYVYEVSTAIIKAGLEKELAEKLDAFILEGTEEGKVLLTSELLAKNKFSCAFSKVYKIVKLSRGFEETVNFLKRSDYGKVVLKFKIDPKDYWKEREKYQRQLRGRQQAVLFRLDNKRFPWMVCEELI
jgi:hypothetical protein